MYLKAFIFKFWSQPIDWSLMAYQWLQSMIKSSQPDRKRKGTVDRDGRVDEGSKDQRTMSSFNKVIKVKR